MNPNPKNCDPKNGGLYGEAAPHGQVASLNAQRASALANAALGSEGRSQ